MLSRALRPEAHRHPSFVCAAPTPEPDADLLFGSGGTLKVNAIEAESMKAEPQVDITPALTDYLDMVLSRLVCAWGRGSARACG